jgi:hypothetical protein
MYETTTATGERVVTHAHAHHQVSAAIFVGSLILGVALVLSAELTKPTRYEYHPAGTDFNSYVIFDKETGQATATKTDTKDPTASFKQ